MELVTLRELYPSLLVFSSVGAFIAVAGSQLYLNCLILLDKRQEESSKIPWLIYMRLRFLIAIMSQAAVYGFFFWITTFLILYSPLAGWPYLFGHLAALFTVTVVLSASAICLLMAAWRTLWAINFGMIQCGQILELLARECKKADAWIRKTEEYLRKTDVIDWFRSLFR